MKYLAMLFFSVICSLWRQHSLGIVLQVLRVQQTLHLLTVEERKKKKDKRPVKLIFSQINPLNCFDFWTGAGAQEGLRAFMLTKVWELKARSFGFAAVRNWPGAGRLAGVLEGLMVTVQHKHYGSQQLVHPLQTDRKRQERRGRKTQDGRGREKTRFIYGQLFFNSDARGF